MEEERRSTNDPVIRIWTPDENENPQAHQHMRKFAEKIPFLQSILAPHGILEADVSPPLKSDHDDGTHYFLTLKSSAKPMGMDEDDAISRAIRREIQLEGNIGGGPNPHDVPTLMAEHGFLKMELDKQPDRKNDLHRISRKKETPPGLG